MLRGDGARPPWFAVPGWAWSALRPLARWAERRDPDTLLSSQTLRMLGLSFAFSGARARAELGWSPRPFPEVLADTIEALRARGALPPAP